MVFAGFQQRFGPEPVQERGVQTFVQQTVETSLDIVVEDDLRIGETILAVIILHQIVPVDADSLVLAAVIVQVGQIAGDRHQAFAADETVILLDRIADVSRCLWLAASA